MKKITILPLLACGLFAITGCGGTPGGGDEEVTIRVDTQYGKGLQTNLERFAKEFEEKNPKIHVEINQVSGSYIDVYKKEKMDMETGQGDWGDIVSCYPDHLIDYLMTYRRLVNVDQYIKDSDPSIGLTQAELDDFTDSAKMTLNTKFPATGTYCLPFSSSTECMFYNPEILNLTFPSVIPGEPNITVTEDYINSLTWEELFDNFCPSFLAYNETLPADRKIIDTSGDYSVLSYDDDGNFFITLCEQYKGEGEGTGYTSIDADRNPSLDFNSEFNRNLMKKFNEAKNKHYVLSEGSYNAKRPTQSLFANRKGIFAVASTGGITYLQTAIESSARPFDCKCAQLPHAEGHDQKMISQGGSLCILSRDSSDNKARTLAAWKFYKYMISQQNCTIWAAQTGYAPIRKSVLRTEDWADLINETDKTGIELLTARNAKYAAGVQDVLYQNEVFKGSSSARTYVDGLLSEILTADTATCTNAWVKTKFDACENNIRTDM